MNNIAFFQNAYLFVDIIQNINQKNGDYIDTQIKNFRIHGTPSIDGYSIVSRNILNGYDLIFHIKDNKTEIIVRILNEQIKLEKNKNKLDKNLLIIHKDLIEVTNFKCIQDKLKGF